MNRLRWLSTTLLAAVVLLDIVLIVRLWHVRKQGETRERTSVVRTAIAGDGVNLMDHGRQVDGSKLQSADRHRPLLVRYAAKSCWYCDPSYDTVWPAFADAMEAKGVPVVVLLPDAVGVFDEMSLIPAGAPQVGFVSMEWAKRFRLSVTPTVVLFDNAGEIVWARHGVLPAASVESALAALAEQ